MSSGWEIVVGLVEDWLDSLDESSRLQVIAALELLSEHGPQLGRPIVDTLSGSRHRNMKELRPGSKGDTEIRVLFAFDPERRAVLLVAGDKSGDWKTWYSKTLPIADRRFDEHLERIKRRRQ